MASVSVVSSNVQTNRNPAVGEVTTVVDAEMFSPGAVTLTVETEVIILLQCVSFTIFISIIMNLPFNSGT